MKPSFPVTSFSRQTTLYPSLDIFGSTPLSVNFLIIPSYKIIKTFPCFLTQYSHSSLSIQASLMRGGETELGILVRCDLRIIG
jgi:hypothetical protein